MEKTRVGTASWTDKTLIESSTFYPRQVTTSEDRLRFYAEHFDTVEVDSTYYALPAERNALLWARRTPPGFVFHIKAYSMLTGHPTLVKSIPKVLRQELPKEILEKAQVKEFPKEVVEAAFDMFAAALRPLKEAGKLGCLLFQFPPWFVPSARAYTWLELVREKLPDHHLSVEFRNWRWITSPEKETSLKFLKDHTIAYVVIDAPWIKGWEGPVVVTAPIAYVRFHGRNRENWFKKGVETVERYRYLYKEADLKRWAEKVKRASHEADQTFAIFNNCYENYGIKNAKTFQQLLQEA
ncbi:MAG: DUF72 domain-containing protein [Deltaproteobacteria bacterium]|nr:DUF72 domain-containing protein [Deltaproteobacteria bacterium]RLB82417.1 MAG: hypothetical protein DRH17_05765 [Deltaproteobacteria bacterium]